MCKFGRKFTSALLALALFVSLLPIGAAPAQAAPVTLEGAGTAEDPYRIKNEVDLAQFARIVGGNSGYVSNPNACAELTANIDLSVSWKPIGTCEAHKEEPITFTGTFDGNGHTISGNIDNMGDNMGDNYQESTDVGLFARLGSGGTVKNLKFTGSVIGVGRATNIGGIVGKNIGIVTNCTFSGSVNGGSATNVGGIVGQNGIGGSVTDCTFSSGSLSGNGNVGGIVGQNNSSVTDCSNNGGFSISGSGNNFGGVVGNNSGTVENCSNSGSFSVPAPPNTASGNLGGVVGQNSGALAPGLPAATTSAISAMTFLAVLLTATLAASLGITLTTAASRTPTTPAPSGLVMFHSFRVPSAVSLGATLATAASQTATTAENSAVLLIAPSAAL